MSMTEAYGFPYRFITTIRLILDDALSHQNVFWGMTCYGIIRSCLHPLTMPL